jgi:hypothetical protein
LDQIHVFLYLEGGLLLLLIKGMHLKIDNIYILIVITTIRILASVKCGVFKLSKVNHLTILYLPVPILSQFLKRKKTKIDQNMVLILTLVFLTNYENKKIK